MPRRGQGMLSSTRTSGRGGGYASHLTTPCGHTHSPTYGPVLVLVRCFRQY